LGAILIGLVLAFFAYLLILGIRDLMIGKSASLEIEEKIREVALSVDEVREVLDLKTLHLGSEKLLVNLGVHMQKELKTQELEKLIEKIKLNIQKEVPSVKYLQVELETRRK
jgi:divalent metal cation (Fe/Co/Zn/Cd) transporter